MWVGDTYPYELGPVRHRVVTAIGEFAAVIISFLAGFCKVRVFCKGDALAKACFYLIIKGFGENLKTDHRVIFLY